MTNKLPKIGQRYRLKNKNRYIVEVLPIIKILEDGTGSIKEYGVEVFNEIYEEIPTTAKAEATENAVDKAKEEFLEKPKSIWKDVSEKPSAFYSPFVYIEFISGAAILGRFHHQQFCDVAMENFYLTDIVKKWCYLKDYLIEHDQMKQDIEILKTKLEGK